MFLHCSPSFFSPWGVLYFLVHRTYSSFLDRFFSFFIDLFYAGYDSSCFLIIDYMWIFCSFLFLFFVRSCFYYWFVFYTLVILIGQYRSSCIKASFSFVFLNAIHFDVSIWIGIVDCISHISRRMRESFLKRWFWFLLWKVQ